MIKILTDDIETISIISPEKDAVLKLRKLLDCLDKSEITALATILCHSYSTSLGRWVIISAAREFSEDLTTALLQIPALSQSTKLALATELLQFCQEEPASDSTEDKEYDGDVDVDTLPNRFQMGV